MVPGTTGGEQRVQSRAKAHLGQEMGTQVAESWKQIRSHHQLWPLMMKNFNTMDSNEHRNAKPVQEQENGYND